MSPFAKTLAFTLLVPGTVAGVVPALLRGGVALGSHGPLSTAAGAATLAAGVAVYAWCAWDFAAAGRGTPSPTDPPRALVRRGLYRWSRNPMYVGVLLAIAGQGIWSASRATFVYVVLLALAFHLRVVLAEEPTLRRSFGAAYDDYAARVPRWVGRRGAVAHRRRGA